MPTGTRDTGKGLMSSGDPVGLHDAVLSELERLPGMGVGTVAYGTEAGYSEECRFSLEFWGCIQVIKGG